MKTTIFTANVAKIDHPQQITDQIYSHGYKCFKEPIEGKSHRLSARFYKTLGLTHYEPDTDIAIWLDHRVDVVSADFIGFVLEQIQGKHMVIAKHPERNTLREEYEYINANLDKPYLKERYEHEPWDKEIEAYSDSLDAVLLNSRFFAIDLRKKPSRTLLADWWHHINKYTIFDQGSITYLLHNSKKNFKWSAIEWQTLYFYLKVNKHK